MRCSGGDLGERTCDMGETRERDFALRRSRLDGWRMGTGSANFGWCWAAMESEDRGGREGARIREESKDSWPGSRVPSEPRRTQAKAPQPHEAHVFASLQTWRSPGTILLALAFFAATLAATGQGALAQSDSSAVQQITIAAKGETRTLSATLARGTWLGTVLTATT